MAKDPNLFGPPRSDLLERVTKSTRRPGLPLLPADQAVPASGLTPQEEEALRAANWAVDDVPSPSRPAAQAVAGVPLPPTAAPGPPPGTPVEAETVPGLSAVMAAADKAIAAEGLPPPADDTGGAAAGLTHCPHCQWPLDHPDPVEPTWEEKQIFLQTFLGGVPFVQAVPLFGGRVRLAMRTLTVGELELIYRQTDRDQQEGRIPGGDTLSGQMAYAERITRYRVVLQLTGFVDTHEGGPAHVLPDGYSRRAAPDAKEVWVEEADEKHIPPGETGLPTVEADVIGRALKTEAVFRVVAAATARFNRLAAKLEALADNSDFWKPTGSPS